MKTWEIFACLKPGYKAVCNGKEDHEVFVNVQGLFCQVDDFGHCLKFSPEDYPNATWTITTA